jgi:hypothetical protein
LTAPKVADNLKLHLELNYFFASYSAILHKSNGVIMNSYHQAILEATNNGKFPELGDLWRNYHPTSVLSDSEYYYEEACRFEPTTSEEAITGSHLQKRLYVPVTRKVSSRSRKNAIKLHTGMI